MTLDGSDLAILIPLWQRTENIERVRDSIRVTTPRARIVWIVTADDLAVIEAATWALRDDVLLAPVQIIQCVWQGGMRGDYAKKINEGYRATTEPFLFTGADDLIFHDGWYDAARPLVTDASPRTAAAGSVAAQYQVGVVGTNDLANPRTMNGDHSTHTLVARWYADCCAVNDQPGAIYHEGYWHEYCDDELVQTAKARGAYAHAVDAHVEHLHPIVGPGRGVVEDDDVYRHGRSRSRDSRLLFMRRARRWRFPFR